MIRLVGAVSGDHWFHLQWDSWLQPLPIIIKEMIPVIAAAVFAHGWSGKILQFYIDDQF